MRKWLYFFLLCAGIQASAENLLKNPGFEEVLGSRPAGWAVFVQPQAGSLARVDGAVAASGKFSALLRNAKAYAVEPANNWSQNVLGAMAGATLKLTAQVRSSGAAEAEVWVQCGRLKPWAVLETATSATQTPVYGETPWTPVEVTVKAPPGTDYVAVRCVIKGEGSGWFDDLALERVAEAPKPAPPAEPAATTAPPEATAPEAGSEAPPVREPIVAPPQGVERPALPKRPVMRPDTGKSDAPAESEASVAPEALAPLAEGLEALEPNADLAELMEKNESLRSSNAAMSRQLRELRQELDRLRTEVDKLRQRPPIHLDAPALSSPPLTPPRSSDGSEKGFAERLR